MEKHLWKIRHNNWLMQICNLCCSHLIKFQNNVIVWGTFSGQRSTLSSPSTSQCSSLLYLTDPCSWDTDMLELRSCKQSSLPFKQNPQMTKGTAVRKELAWGAFFLCLLAIGSSRQPVAKCCSLSEQFSPGGFPCSVWQSCVAGHERRAQKWVLYPWYKSSIFSLLSLDVSSYVASNWVHKNFAHIKLWGVWLFFTHGDPCKFLVKQSKNMLLFWCCTWIFNFSELLGKFHTCWLFSTSNLPSEPWCRFLQ